jgi:hypothetical protein
MAYSVSFSCVTTHTARKVHRCEYCRGSIPIGTRHVKLAGKWEGDFYSGRGHEDCRQLWHALYNEFAGDEGMAWDLPEVLTDWMPHEAQQSLDAQRGYFPHAVNRIEFRLRNWIDVADDDFDGVA